MSEWVAGWRFARLKTTLIGRAAVVAVLEELPFICPMVVRTSGAKVGTCEVAHGQESGNRGGRHKVLGEVQELARQHAPSAIAELARLALKAKSERYLRSPRPFSAEFLVSVA